MLQRCYPGLKYKQNTDSVARLDLEKCQNVPDLVKDHPYALHTPATIMHHKGCLLVQHFTILEVLFLMRGNPI